MSTAIIVPPGGAVGQTLVKASIDDYHTDWASAAVPAGGASGEVLTKTSGADYAVAWAPGGGGGGGLTQYQVRQRAILMR
jgi:hypothetical protein